MEVLKHLDGRRVLENARERMTDYEAVQIAIYRDVQVAARVAARFERYGTSSREARARAMQENPGTGFFDPYIEQRAYEAYVAVTNRMDVTLGVLERASSRSSAAASARRCCSSRRASSSTRAASTRKRATEAARRANASLYFIDTRGLEGLSRPTAPSSAPPSPTRTSWPRWPTSTARATGRRRWPPTPAASRCGTRTTSPPARCASARSRAATTCSATTRARSRTTAASARSRSRCAAAA